MCPHLEERERGGFLQRRREVWRRGFSPAFSYCASVQVRPPSVVENRRPSARVAVAASRDELLIATTPTCSSAIGRSAHVPSAARTNTCPASPASQHTSAVGTVAAQHARRDAGSLRRPRCAAVARSFEAAADNAQPDVGSRDLEERGDHGLAQRERTAAHSRYARGLRHGRRLRHPLRLRVFRRWDGHGIRSRPRFSRDSCIRLPLFDDFLARAVA